MNWTLKETKSVPKGEPFVWFTATGLVTGLIMIVFLLGLIFFKGIEVFWPRAVYQLEIAEDSDVSLRGAKTIAGVKIKEHEAQTMDGGTQLEWQLYVGNKDFYGFNFKYIPMNAVTAKSQPKGMMRLERFEYGDALIYPVSLALKSGETIRSDSEHFNETLHALIEESNARRREIRAIENGEIGAINAQMQKIHRQHKKASARKDVSEGYLKDLEQQQAQLQVRYELLAAEAKTLRRRQDDNQMVYQDAAGREGRISAGKLIHFYYPNQISFLDKTLLFFEKIWRFLSEEPREANTEGGVFPAIFGTFAMTLLMSIAVMPFGVLAAIYLREYAKQGFFVRCVRIAVNNLAGVPSIVFGVFGLGFFVYFMGGSFDRLFFSDRLPTPTMGTGGILWASLTLALLTVPVVIVATEEALAAVPRGMREGSLACGASKWQTIRQIVLPAAAPGIMTGLILAMARGASEVAPLMLVGVVKLAPTLPIDGVFPFIHFERKFMHLGFHIYDLGFQSPDSEAAKPMVFATTLLLILLVIVLNLGTIIIRQHLKKKNSVGAF